MTRWYSGVNPETIKAIKAHKKRRAGFKFCVDIIIPHSEGDAAVEKSREILATLNAICQPIKGQKPQQDVWMITGRRKSPRAYRIFTVRFRNPRDATYFKLKCGGA